MTKKIFYCFLFFILIGGGVAGAQDRTVLTAETAAITMTSSDDNLSVTSTGSLDITGVKKGIDLDAGDDNLTNQGTISINSSATFMMEHSYGIHFGDSVGNDNFTNEGNIDINSSATGNMGNSYCIYFGEGNNTFTNKGNISTTGNAASLSSGIIFGAGDSNLINEGTMTITDKSGIIFGAGDNNFTNEGTITITVSDTFGDTMGMYLGAGNNIFTNEGTMTITCAGTGSNYGIYFGGGDNTFTNEGTMTILSGTNAIIMGGGNDNFINSGVLDFNSSIDGGTGADVFTLQGTEARAFDQDILNFETIDKNETGSWDLTGAITGASNININEGELYLNGNVAATGINFTSEGTLGVAGKDSIGTLNYTGSFTQGSGTLLVDVNNTDADLLSITGNANISGGKLLVNPLLAEGEEFDDGWTQQIVGATTLTGEFAEIASTSALFSFDANYDTANQVLLEQKSLDLLSTMESSSIPITANAIAQGTYIQNAMAAGASYPVIDAITALPTPEAINKAMDTLSPEPVASAISASKQNVSAQHANVSSRMGGHHKGLQKGKSKFTAGLASDYYPILYADSTNANTPLNSFWVKALYLNAENDSGDSFGFTTNTQGVSIGRDYLSGNFLYGVSGGYSQSDIEYDNVDSEGDTNTLNLSLYGSYNPGAYYLDTILSYSNHDYKMTRGIPILNETATGDYRADEYGAYLKGGYPVALSGWTVTPIASVQYSHYKQNSFTETGSSAALFVDAADSDSFVTGLGASIEKTLDYGEWKLLPHISLTWNHEFCDTANKVKSGFADFGGSLGTFEVEGYDAGAETYNAGLGVTAYKGNNFSLFLNYDLGIKEDYIANSVTGGLKFYF